MTITDVMQICRDFLSTGLLVALPALAVSLVVGVIISVLQTITSIQEQTLSFVPRLLAVGGAMLLCLGWMLRLAVHFAMHMIAGCPEFVK